MGVYSRFKKNPEGFRALVELLETTPASKRERMIEVGMAEDAEYTLKALKHMMTFDDVLNLSESELAELVATAPPKMIGFAIHKSDEETQKRFLRCARPGVIAQIREALEVENVGLREVGGAQLKVIESARALERKGLVKVKRIGVIE